MKMICNLEGKGVGCGGPLFFQDAIRSFQLEEKSQNQTYCVKWAKPFGRTWALNRWQLQVYGGYGGEKPSASVHTWAMYVGTLAQVLPSPSYFTTQIMPVHLTPLPLEWGGNGCLSL